MIRRELEVPPLLDRQADELRGSERSFVGDKRNQLDPAGVIERRLFWSGDEHTELVGFQRVLETDLVRERKQIAISPSGPYRFLLTP